MENIIKTILKVLLVIVVLVVMTVVGIAGATVYKRWEKDLVEKNNNIGNIIGTITGEEETLEECVTCLFMGVNGHLTDFIMLGQYNPNTRDIALLSIPRDTNVTNSVDGKINSLYAGRYPEKVMKKVEEITGIEVQHYLIFDTSILRKVVDEIGGVTIDVPINMNYDDPAQNLYIHIKKGKQTLNGKSAEHFVRFRQNSDGSGYLNGDVGRIAAQQSFIKAMVSEVLDVKNISKIGNLVKIVLDNTKTDITMELVSQYIDDIITIKTDRIRIETMPGEGRYGMSPYGYKLSYYYHDAEKTKELVEDLFKSGTKDASENNDLVETSAEMNNDSKVRIEVLNASSNMHILNNIVVKLDEENFDVVKIGNYNTVETEASRILDYGIGTEEELNELKELLGISKVEKVEDSGAKVKYSIIIGQNYK